MFFESPDMLEVMGIVIAVVCLCIYWIIHADQ